MIIKKAQDIQIVFALIILLTVMKIYEYLNKEHGITIIIITHDLELAQKTNHVIKLHDGLIIEGKR